MTEKILKIVTIVMFAVTAVILGMFIWGGDVPDQQYTTPVYTASLLNWAYVLFVIAVIAAVIFPIVRLFTRPKQAMKSFIGLAALAVVVLIAYAMADGTPMNIIGYSGTDNVPSRLIFSDTIIYTMYILFGAAIIAIFATELLRKVR
ncbi:MULTISPECIES: hypothetical protein [Culturomica]|mgnify:FL=1|jgi:TRAP-type C4-dicarboxylate transport system permease small subunit|uniref:hypothetical protein n=1 Tax=Culturomica TaxID=1926651 RepID=UPI0003407553|nr:MULTISPECIES: hypothetical protein [Odoribacteraceae]RHV93231.1 hypothetical protein DXA95_10915 [Odoribacter sp. OF09-27XD]CCZ07804.1 putative uncharacterized protein [Odoribacter sp. CAG:788]HBO25600.1 hypothetical protein [Culturomica sp.]